jgi:hypothetical protein
MSLKNPVELPGSSVGVDVPDATVLIFRSIGGGREDTFVVEILTLISIV